jgi:hypothetical protein
VERAVVTTAISPRTLRLAANAFDRFIAQKSNLSRQERDELLELADLLRAVARREGDLLLSAQHPDEMSPEAKPGTRRLGLAAAPASDPSYPTDPDGGLPRDDAWDAHCYAEGMAPFARGEGNLS